MNNNIPTVQIVGAFNTGTNLVTRVINAIFDVNIQKEGHTIFWKHTCLSNNFKIDPNVWYIIVTKHPYWWFHSIRKAPYSLKTENPNLPIGDFLKQKIRVQFPRMSYTTDRGNIYFANFIDYYNKFYNGCLEFLPKNKTIVIRYYDFLHNPMKTVLSLAKCLPAKKPLKSLNKPKRNNSKAKELANDKIKKIFVRPTKHHGNPRHGMNAINWYKKGNLNKLFNDEEYNWINKCLDKKLLGEIGYKTCTLKGKKLKVKYKI
jgi:hypothetical protein